MQVFSMAIHKQLLHLRLTPCVRVAHKVRFTNTYRSLNGTATYAVAEHVS